jgi:hypothetical protein
MEIFLIKHKFGNINCETLQKEIENNISFSIQDLTIEYSSCKFTRKKPPLSYIMDELWGQIFPFFKEKTEDFEVGLEDILKVTYDFFIPWSGLEGEYSQVRKSWIREALSEFCEIGLANKIGSERYRILFSKDVEKDRIDYFIRRICRNEIEKSKKVLSPERQDEEMQRLLSEFDGSVKK